MNIPTSSFLTDTDQTGILLIRSLGIPPMDAFLLLKDLLDTSRGRGDRITRAKRCIRLGGEALADRETSVPFSQAVRASKETPPAPHPAGNPLYGCPDDEKMPGTDKKTGSFHHAGRLRALSPQKLFHSPPAAQGAADPERHPEFFPEARVVPQKRGLSGSSPHPQGKTHQGPFPVRGKTASPHRGTVVPRGMPAGLRPDAVRGHTPPRSQKADLEEHQPEIRPGFTGAQPYQNRREPPRFHPSRAGRHPQPDVFRRFPLPSRLPAQLGKEMEGSKAPVRHPEKKRMGAGRAEAYLRLLSPGPFLQSKPSSEGDGALLPLPAFGPLS